MMKHSLLPRIIHIGQGPAYLGMCRAVFDRNVRPHLIVIKIGAQV